MIDNEFIRKKVQQDMYPEGDEMRSQIERRRRVGTGWRMGFLAATILAIIILLVLLLTIINQSFGYVAEQSAVPEQALVTDFNKSRVASETNIMLSSEDDALLAEGIAGDPNGVGFFGFGYFDANREGLRALALNGVPLTEETVRSGEYPGIRPLFLYTSPQTLEENPDAAAFLIYYLQHLEDVVTDAGFFLADEESLAAQEQTILEALGTDTLPTIDPAEYSGSISVTGSSTVFPITEQMAQRFIADGYQGDISVESVGTGAGFDAYCIEKENVDIVDASRPIDQIEYEACSASGRTPAEFRVATDALAVVVSAQNEFAQDLTQVQVEQLFTTAVTWSDIDPNWPDVEITRYIPTIDSGTMDFFVQEMFLEQSLTDIPYDELVGIYTTNVTLGRCRAVEREQRFYADRLVCDPPEKFAEACASDNPPAACTAQPRDAAQVRQLIEAEVIQPEVLKSWYLLPSLTQRADIFLETATRYPNAELKFKTWLNWDFVSSPQSSQPEIAGVRTAIFGSLWVVFIAVLLGFPLGVAAAVYLEEYADHTKWYNRIIQTNINNLAGVPSIIYGMLGLAVFVRALEPITSGVAFGLADPTTANGRTILSAGLTLGLLGLPIIIIAAQEAVRAVPPSLREASMGLGATKWQTIWNHVLPNALPGILTGTILTMSRVIGETAPLVVVGASTFITTDPTGPFSKFTTLPAQIYQWTTRPQDTFRNIAGASIIVLLVLLLMLNAFAIYMRNRFSKRFA